MPPNIINKSPKAFENHIQIELSFRTIFIEMTNNFHFVTASVKCH